MTISNKQRRLIVELCGAINADDCVDANDFHHRKPQNSRQIDLKQLRLCRHAEQTISSILHQSSVPAIRELALVAVLPGRRGTLIAQFDRGSRSQAECQDLLKLLRQQCGWIRAEIAAAVQRKRTPNLVFEMIATPDNSASIEGEA